jgi:hypothetical protein
VRLGRRTRVVVAKSAPTLLFALLLTTFGAAGAMERDQTSATVFFLETSVYLVAGLLVLVSGRCAGAAQRVFSLARREHLKVARFLRRSATSAIRESALAIMLAAPVLTAAWGYGASREQVLSSMAGAGVASACGIVFGLFFGSMKIPPSVGVPLAVSAGALLLWPRTLMWASGFPRSFPAPETRPAVIGAVLIVGVLFVALRARMPS